ncbi:MAG: hypothetical protein IH939_03375 [Acidobacteria bacterium]|nr:hypothetical protein [Acidobacteriota bacterium]
MSATPTVSSDLSTAATAIASERGLRPNMVRDASKLLSDGNTIPCIARYCKGNTGGLDDVQIGIVDDATGCDVGRSPPTAMATPARSTHLGYPANRSAARCTACRRACT